MSGRREDLLAGLGCGMDSAGPEAVSWQYQVRLSMPSGGPQAGESTPGQVAECFPVPCVCGQVSHCLHISGSPAWDSGPDQMIDSLAGRTATFPDEAA